MADDYDTWVERANKWKAKAQSLQETVDRLTALCREVRPALETTLHLVDPNRTRGYDDLAEQFYSETLMMAPGKSVPLEMANSQPGFEARHAAWCGWTNDLRDKVHAAIEAALKEWPR